jgi:mxaC protein
MNDFAFDHPWALVLLALALLPIFLRGYAAFNYPSISRLPQDAFSRWLQRAWRACGALAIAAGAIGLAAPYSGEQLIEHIGHGAHVMIILDRSASMNDDFADQPAPASTSKMAAARKVLSEFVASSRQDLIGMVTFSTSPILVAPLGGDRAAVLAALNATDAGGMGFTAVARGLDMGLDYFADKPVTGARALLLVSDGAAHLDAKTQDELRNKFARQGAALYWIYLRSTNGPSLEKPLETDSQQSYPEYELHEYFKTLGVGYHAYEADNPQAVASAIKDISRLKNHPLKYSEAAPKHDLSAIFYGLALLCVLALLALYLTEVKQWHAE